MSLWRALSWCLALGLPLGTIHPEAAAAQPAAEPASNMCALSYERGQLEHREGRLVEARQQFSLCRESKCPVPIVERCSARFRVVDGAIPTFVVSAKDEAGADVFDVRVVVDGRLAASQLDGRPIMVNPGRHVVLFERRGAVPLQREYLFVESAKNRAINVALPANAPPAPSVSASASSQSPIAPAVPVRAGIPTASYVLAAISGVSLLTFVGLGIRAVTYEGTLQTECAPNCRNSQAEGVRNFALAADVALGISIASLGAAALIYFLRGTTSGRAPVGLAPTAVLTGSAGFVGLRGSF